MTIDEVVMLLKASLPNALTPLQELVLRSSWEGKTYTIIAFEAHYGEERVRKVASHLWQLLSDLWKEPISKSNFRSYAETCRLTRAQQQLIKEFNRTATAISLEFPSGPVSLNSRFYIPRPPIEELAYSEITEPGSLICIRATKKMGKSSLILRILAHAAKLGYRTVSLDFQQADKAVFANLDKFLRWFCANVSRELGLEPRLNDFWNEDMGTKISCSVYFQSYLLSANSNPLVLALNEVDWVFEYPEIALDFLPLLCYWYEQAKGVEVWQKLRLVLAYSTETFVPQRVTKSPFNIGLPIKLPPFTSEQVEILAQRHGLDWKDSYDAQRLMAMVGGHPYLVRLAFYHIMGKGGLQRDLDQILEQAPTEAGIYNDYLRQYVLALQQEPELEAAFYEVITATGFVKLEPVVAYKLESMGLVNLEGDRAYTACELYRLYFQDHLHTKYSIQTTVPELLEMENLQGRAFSSVDELTQLANRRYFNVYLQMAWQQSIRDRTFLSLILCDLDYFKFYNQFYGDPAGDHCLQQIANTIRNCVNHPLSNSSFSYASTVNNGSEYRSSTNSWYEGVSVLLARYGGEEFAILTQTDAAGAVHLAENIREQVKALAIKNEYPSLDSQENNVLTVSLGVASIIPQPESELASLVNAAEQALYIAKRKGRDRVVFG